MKETEIKEALDNIKELRTLIEKKQKQLAPMIFSKDFVNTLLSASLVIFITTIVIGFGYLNYPSFWNFPLFLKALIILLVIGNFIQLSIRKLKAFNKNLNIPLAESLNDFLNADFITTVFLGFFFIIIFAKITNLNWVYLPLITVFYGLIVINFSEKLSIIEFKYMGYITILIGTISMLFLQIPLLLLGFAMYSLIFFSYFLILNTSRRKYE